MFAGTAYTNDYIFLEAASPRANVQSLGESANDWFYAKAR